jgi:hypothetical protein
MSRALALTVTLLVDAYVLGCGAPDRPPPAGDPEGEVDPAAAAALAQAADLHATHPTCEPGGLRECRIYFRDESGQMQCPTQSQFCRADGRGWLPCGGGRDVGEDPSSP